MDNTSLDTLKEVQWYIDIISIPICLVFGTFGNILSFIVYIRKWSSFTVPLVFLSCFDLLMLWTDSVFSGAWAYFGQLLEQRPLGCAISYYLYLALFFSSTFTIAMYTILRTYAVVRPLKFAPIFTVKRVFYIAFTVTLIVFGGECHYIFGVINVPVNNTTLLYRHMACDYRPGIFSTFYYNYWFLVEGIVILGSVGTVVAGNIVIIISLCRRKLTSNTTIDTSEISRRLIAISTVHVLMWAPWIVLSIMATGYDKDSGATEKRLLIALAEVALILVRIQSGFGFLLYTFIGSEFRAEFLKTICCKTGEI